MVAQINATRSDGKILILSYSFDLPPMQEALKNALMRGVAVKIVVDQYALINQKGSFKAKPLEQLSNLHAAGAKIFVYCDGGLLKNHTKIIAIIDSKRVAVGQGSYNLTTSSRESFNSFTWYPDKDSKRMLYRIKEIYNEMKKKLLVFERILNNSSFAETRKMITDFINEHTPKKKKKYVAHS